MGLSAKRPAIQPYYLETSTFKNYLIVAWRNIKWSKAYSVLNILGFFSTRPPIFIRFFH